MKTYSVGRDLSCDIVINDNSDVISRRHAIIQVAGNGDITITDCSTNGTYVNGIRIAGNTPVPVTRNDSISFAHVSKLDWNMIPKQRGVFQYALYALCVIVAVCLAFGVIKYIDNRPTDSGGTAIVAQDSINKESVAKDDSIKKTEDAAKAGKSGKEAAKDKEKDKTARKGKASQDKDKSSQGKDKSSQDKDKSSQDKDKSSQDKEQSGGQQGERL